MLTDRVDWIARARALRPQIRDFIDGRWCPVDGDAHKKFAPRDGGLLSEFGACDLRKVDAAVNSARRAFDDGRWCERPVQARKQVLLRLAGLIEKDLEHLALLESLDVGKPITDALTIDVPSAAAVIRMNAEIADKCFGDVYGVDRASMAYQLRRPIGVVGAIVGWNFPLLLAAQKIGPALAAGNSLVLKPSEVTSFTASRIAELAVEAGVPEGVLNVIHGAGALGSALARHHDVDLVSFTGSSATGKRLLIASGESNMKRLILECGGKAPSIVFDDCPDLDGVAAGIVKRAFWNQGEVCTASSRLLLQESIKEKLLPLIVEKTAALDPQDPLRAESKFGALVSHGHRLKVQAYIARGAQQGARIAYQSDAPVPHEGGFYVAPVIFDNVAPKSSIAQEEIFGPVLSVLTFRDDEEAIRLANNTIYGLSATVWTRNIARAHRMTHGIKAGWITVNSTDVPQSEAGGELMSVGGHKQSGIGTEGGAAGMEAYMTSTAVQIFV
jgi:acyl-CoA reductase-like NAD-dependent aldehyde dehydrogenase